MANEVPDWIQKAIENGGSHEEPVDSPDSDDILNTLLRIEAKMDRLIDSRHDESMVPVDDTPPRIDLKLVKTLIGCMVDDKRIEVVKCIRQMTGCGLKEAVDATEVWWR